MTVFSLVPTLPRGNAYPSPVAVMGGSYDRSRTLVIPETSDLVPMLPRGNAYPPVGQALLKPHAVRFAMLNAPYDGSRPLTAYSPSPC